MDSGVRSRLMPAFKTFVFVSCLLCVPGMFTKSHLTSQPVVLSQFYNLWKCKSKEPK